MSKISLYFFAVVKQNIYCFMILFIYSVFRFKNLEEWYSHLMFSIVVFSLVLSLIRDVKRSYDLLCFLKKIILFFVIMLVLAKTTLWLASLVDNLFDMVRILLGDMLISSNTSFDYDTFFYVLSSLTAKSFLFALCASIIYMATILPLSKVKFYPMSFKSFLINFGVLFAINSLFLFLWNISYSKQMYDLLLYSGAINEVVNIFLVLAIGRITYEEYCKKHYERDDVVNTKT
ncbi:hypothetical protein [Maridesulfovibrio ferrireducens]|uniref:hypothetical protein n=1 Tax=Maridesulfovibrio ferrireducens TaxID=246191 RepID=UPI000B8A31D4|nr:hypothetical protein [Maridesulfovibrio ferrireducens]